MESAPPSTRAHEGHVPVLPRHANSFVIILIYAPVSRRAAQRRPTSAGATSFTRSWLSRPKYPCPPYYVESSTSALCYTPREERIALAFASFVWLGDETANGPDRLSYARLKSSNHPAPPRFARDRSAISTTGNEQNGRIISLIRYNAVY